MILEVLENPHPSVTRDVLRDCLLKVDLKFKVNIFSNDIECDLVNKTGTGHLCLTRTLPQFLF